MQNSIRFYGEFFELEGLEVFAITFSIRKRKKRKEKDHQKDSSQPEVTKMADIARCTKNTEKRVKKDKNEQYEESQIAAIIFFTFCKRKNLHLVSKHSLKNLLYTITFLL